MQRQRYAHLKHLTSIAKFTSKKVTLLCSHIPAALDDTLHFKNLYFHNHQ